MKAIFDIIGNCELVNNIKHREVDFFGKLKEV